MSAKIRRVVQIGGKTKWIQANTEQEYANKLLALVSYTEQPIEKHDFESYAMTWFEVFCKPNVATVTAETYARQIRLYLIPTFKGKSIEDISPEDIQKMFNSMDCAKSTKDKVKSVLNMILSAAIEDNYITRSPLNSSRIRITGAQSETTKEYSIEQMQYLVSNLDKITSLQDKAYLALQALHPLRLEEVLGLSGSDIDFEKNIIHIRRAVTHPTRNAPEVKGLKTEASKRDIGLSKIAIDYLKELKVEGRAFVIGGKQPLTYTQVRRMCNRIQRETGFTEKITPLRFRTTVLTDIYEQTKDIKDAQAAAGHTTATMTLKHYVKGRGNTERATQAIDQLYSS